MPSEYIAKVNKKYTYKIKYAYLIICINFCISLLYSEQDSSIQYLDRAFAYFEQSESGAVGYKYYTDVYDGQYLTIKTKTIRSILQVKETYELGADQNFYVVSSRWKNNDTNIPTINKINSHQFKMFRNQSYLSLRDNFVNRLNKQEKLNNKRGGAINLFSQNVGGTNIAVSLKGNISISGILSFEDRENITTTSQQSDSWNLDINQTQKFNLEGNIGDKLTIKAEQNSESDFDWENSLLLEYNGNSNEIIQNVSAGNISLNLPHTQLVSVGMGKREGLFGVKFVNQLGPMSLQTIIGREKVQKTSQSIYGGQSEDGFTINDYNFIKDKYFFLDKNFKRGFYPLDINGNHVVNSNYVILDYQVFKRITNMNGIESGIYVGTAFLDPLDENSYIQEGIWKKLDENIDYDLNKYLGYIRLNTPSSSDVIAVHYTIGVIEGSNIVEPDFDIDIGTNIDVVYNQEEYDICLNTTGCETGDTSLVIDTDYQDIDGDGIYTGQEIILKLIKDSGSSTVTSKTWPLMFKNVYSLGATNIDLNTLELDIVHKGGQLGTETTTPNGNTFLNVFGLDNKNENGEIILDPTTGTPIGDGKIDLNSNLINSQYGEIFLPFHMPFSYDENSFEQTSIQYDNGSEEDLIRFWGNPHPDLEDLFDGDFESQNFDEYNDIFNYDDGPAMYYSSVQGNITAEHEFIFNVKHSSQSSTISLGFMIVEGSETLTLDGSIQLVKGVDYTIDYFSGTLNLISERAKDPTANIRITYDQNELVSFDQKLVMGSYFKHDFNEYNNIFGGAYLYTQSIADQKVDIGYEPMENFIWHLGGRYSRDFENFNTYFNNLTNLDLEENTSISFLTEFAQIFPNPNSLGKAYLDDFESSKRSTYISIPYSSWKLSSIPLFINQNDSMYYEGDIKNRKNVYWYNPYDEVATTDIWPDIEISNTANNQKTKTLWLETDTMYYDNLDEEQYWGGISIPLFPSDYDQSNNKYLDLWMNVNEVNDDQLKMNIDIGYISEDSNNDSSLSSEDALSINGQLGNGLLNPGEDIGIDKCTDSYEDGWGGCLCSIYQNDMFEFSYDAIYQHETEFCEDPNAQTYIQILNSGNLNQLINEYTSLEDPNLDNFDYNEGSYNYSRFNGTENNSNLSGFTYPDTEDLNNNQSLDNINSYFTYQFNIADSDLNIIESETQYSDLLPTGWKLYRIPLQEFEAISESSGSSVTWEDVRTLRLWIQGNNPEIHNIIKIAKIELVGNEWQDLGRVENSNIGNVSYSEEENFQEDNNITIQVINSDENSEYISPQGVQGEYDEYGGRYTKEQSLVIDFSNLYDNDFDLEGGINQDSTIFIKKNFGFSSMTNDKKNSFFAYKYLEMYINGVIGTLDNDVQSNWSDGGDVQFCLRMGKDDNYYEIRQPFENNQFINNGWENVKINLDELTRYKLNRSSLEDYDDVGIDGCTDSYETGYPSEYPQCLPDSLIAQNITIPIICNDTSYYQDLYANIYADTYPNVPDLWLFDTEICDSEDIADPNQDNCNINEDTGEIELIGDCTENNEQYDYVVLDDENIYGEPVIDDYNLNGYYDVPAYYDDDDEVWIWDEDISIACENCSELRVKGEPAINRIDYIMIGVINDTDNRVFGKVYLNEMRMTGVKREPGTAFLIDGSFDLGELLTLSGNFSQRQADYHMLEERLGTGDHSMQYSLNFKVNTEEFFKEKLFQMPVNIRYNKSTSSPKYKPGSDIILGEINDTPDSLQTLKDYVTIHTSFKSQLSKFSKDNVLFKYLTDNTTIDYTYKWDLSSSPTIKQEEMYSHQFKLNYSLNFEDNELFLFKENLESEKFKYDSETFLHKLLKDFKINLTPEKLEYSVNLNNHDKVTKKRSSYGGTVVYDTSMTMSRTLKITNYKLMDNFNVNYRADMNSNLNDLISDKFKVITGLSNIFDLSFSPGVVKTYSEQFSFTYTPEIFSWLGPRFSYSPKYTWTRDLGTSVDPTADFRSENDFSASFTFSAQKFIENFYTKESGNSNKSTRSSSRRRSSRGRSSRQSTSNSNTHKNFEINNPYLKTVLKFMHTISEDVSNINLTYKYNTKNNFDNINADFEPGYNFRLGLSSNPISGNIEEELGTSSNQILTYSNYYYDEFKIGTSIQLAKNLSLSSMEYRKTRSKSFPSNSYANISTTETFLPLGTNGKDGFPMFKYSINLTGLEKISLGSNLVLSEWFKTVTLNHSFSGENTVLVKDDLMEKNDFSRAFNPVIGIQTKLKNSPINMKFNYNNTLTINNTGVQTERVTKDQLVFSIDYTKKTGYRFKAPFLRDLEIENEINLRLDLNYDENYTDFSYVQTDNLDDFETTAFSKSIGIKPTLTYSFSKFVDGDLYINHSINETHTTGRKKETSIGFKIRIYFESFE